MSRRRNGSPEREREPKNSPPNRNWPNRHREFFAFGKEKLDGELCVRKGKITVRLSPLNGEEVLGGRTRSVRARAAGGGGGDDDGVLV
jgi:hypothetical protein